MEDIFYTQEELSVAVNVLMHDLDPLMILSEDLHGIGHLLRIKRTYDRLTIHELGALLKMSPSLISETETGLRNLRGNKLKLVEDYIYRTLMINGRIEALFGETLTEDYVNGLGIEQFRYTV